MQMGADFNTQLKQAVAETEAVIYGYLPAISGCQKTIFEAMDYSVKAGGKRLRPLLMRETYRLFGGTQKVIEPFMAAMEMIHTSSLIHDDLPCMDNDEFRRGKPTTWKVYGYDMAVLAGDALMIYAFETAAKAYGLIAPESEAVSEKDGGSSGKDGCSHGTGQASMVAVGEAIHVLAEKTGIYGMIGGQTVDVELTGKPVTKEQLNFIYRLKTGALLEASMMIGAILAGASKEQLKTVETMAAEIGLAFQIQDDILDVTSTAEVLGKPVLSDEKNEKTTYVTLKGLEQARADVDEISRRAMKRLEELPGQNVFLKNLMEMLITRKS